ncbi:lipase 3-like [Anticarsia gemmatalis]|uniref:lipase 3-like n=1 Tax=Anticarsia gemmatalis TaxID=129554 RepID=UPI003F75E4D9
MMVLKGIIFLALVAVAIARRAPNADYVEQMFKSGQQTRFSTDIEEDSLLDAPGLIRKYGYPQETHLVTTSDGYILEAHRIPHGRNSSPGPRPAVLIMHGLLSSSADFIVLGPGSALAYILADAGYDVWLGNARGNFYSRRHRTYNPDSKVSQNFWKFSWDEIGNYDLPAFIDYILAKTGQEKLHYIGHSQGGTTFLVLNSLKPEYNSKFISFQGLAPASFFDNNDVSMFNSLAPFENIIETAAFAMGQGEIFGSRDFVSWFTSNYCTPGSIFASICGSSITGMGDRDYYNSTMVPLFMAHAPAGASVRQIAHFGQVIRFKAFRRYNYNMLTNLSKYGRANPPAYNLANVNVPAYIHYGMGDKEVHYKDVFKLADRLPKTVGLYEAGRQSFHHYDFIWADDAKHMVYSTVLKCMKHAESNL